MKKNWEGFKRLVSGNFLFQHNLKYELQRKSLTNGENPRFVIVSCSDARETIPVIFDNYNLGEFLQIKTSAHTLQSAALETIKNSVLNLDPDFIVVMGHTNCSGVIAAVDALNDPELEKEFPTIVSIVGKSVKKVLKKYPNLSHDELVYKSTINHIFYTIKQIQKYTDHKKPILPAIYFVDSGEVKWLDSKLNKKSKEIIA